MAERVWGSFNQNYNVIAKVEEHIGKAGPEFLVERLGYITIDDDKLRRSSKTFGDHGLSTKSDQKLNTACSIHDWPTPTPAKPSPL
jgi:hypothetical protein